jgi:hypothetical protein
LEDEFHFLENGMGGPNKHGLGRTISADVKRKVRQRCGFGCVRCGLGFYDYEHFAPDFKDATTHDPACITLLCMQCNQKRARGLLAAETVAQANAAPYCRQHGFTREEWGFGHGPIEVAFGGLTFTDVNTLIEVNGCPILSVRTPEDGSAFYRLSGIFTDSTGKTTLEIEDNEWSAGIDNWDIECIGPRIAIRGGPRDISLVLKSEPPHRLVIEKLHMRYGSYILRGNENLLEFSMDGVNWSRFYGVSMQGVNVGISLNYSPFHNGLRLIR